MPDNVFDFNNDVSMYDFKKRNEYQIGNWIAMIKVEKIILD